MWVATGNSFMGVLNLQEWESIHIVIHSFVVSQLSLNRKRADFTLAEYSTAQPPTYTYAHTYKDSSCIFVSTRPFHLLPVFPLLAEIFFWLLLFGHSIIFPVILWVFFWSSHFYTNGWHTGILFAYHMTKPLQFYLFDNVSDFYLVFQGHFLYHPFWSDLCKKFPL